VQIKIEIDVKPEELRRFLGLPDVAGLQEEVIQFLRDKVGAASETFDPSSFVKENLQTIRRSGAWQKIVAAAKIPWPDDSAHAAPPPPKGASRRRTPAAARKKSAKKVLAPENDLKQ